MKRTFILFFALVMGLSVTAQESCKVVNEQFTENNLAQVADRLGVSVDYACILATDGVAVSDRSSRDLSALTDIRTLRPAFENVEWITEENFDAETFNILQYQFDLMEQDMQQFKVGNTGLVVTVLSQIRMNAVYQNRQ